MELLLGEIKGKLDAVAAEVKEIKADGKETKLKVEALQQFKWRVAGGAAALSVVLTVIISLIK